MRSRFSRPLAVAALVGAVGLTALAAPSSALAASSSCSRTHLGDYTYGSCYGPDGAYSSSSSTRIGDYEYGSSYGRDSSGRRWSGSSSSTRIGDYDYGSGSRSSWP